MVPCVGHLAQLMKGFKNCRAKLGVTAANTQRFSARSPRTTVQVLCSKRISGSSYPAVEPRPLLYDQKNSVVKSLRMIQLKEST